MEGLNICREHWHICSGSVPSTWGLVLSIRGMSRPSRGYPIHLEMCPTGAHPLFPTQDCQELTDVERAIETVINQFHCYAVKGQKEYLTPNEMQELVVQKLPHLGKVRAEPRQRAGGAGVGTGCLRDPTAPSP